MPERRQQISGPSEIAALLDGGKAVRLLLAREGELCEASRNVLERCREAGVTIREVGQREMKRTAASGEPELLALVGPDPAATLEEASRAGGALWLLTGIAYPGNAGFAIRTAEVSGAVGIAIDAQFDRGARRQALRTAMRADRFFPVFWASAADVVATARLAGRRIVGIEDSGTRAPWQTDLSGAALFVIGGEAGGVAANVLAACDETIRLPMPGFIPSYNLQAAMAMVAGERLRQLQILASPAADDRDDPGLDSTRV